MENSNNSNHTTLDTTVFDLLANRLDIRSIPKKVTLRVLAKYTSDIEQQQRLLYLCSKEGMLVLLLLLLVLLLLFIYTTK